MSEKKLKGPYMYFVSFQDEVEQFDLFFRSFGLKFLPSLLRVVVSWSLFRLERHGRLSPFALERV
jgi:hypothetical protein